MTDFIPTRDCERAYAALRPGGVLAIWSGYPDYSFADHLEDVGVHRGRGHHADRRGRPRPQACDLAGDEATGMTNQMLSGTD